MHKCIFYYKVHFSQVKSSFIQKTSNSILIIFQDYFQGKKVFVDKAVSHVTPGCIDGKITIHMYKTILARAICNIIATAFEMAQTTCLLQLLNCTVLLKVQFLCSFVQSLHAVGLMFTNMFLEYCFESLL